MRRPYRPSRALRARVRPLLERLEGRDAPAVLTVTNLSDHDPGSLRSQIAAAADGDTVQFRAGLGGTITLTTGELLVNKSLTIAEPGGSVLSVSGNHASRVFEVAAGRTVTLYGLYIADGRASEGGGIYNNGGTLTVTGSDVSGNSATFGGGIYNAGTLTLNDSNVSYNSAVDDGGGIYNTGTLTAAASTFVSANSAFLGGGIYNNAGGRLTVSGATVYENSASGYGGGIYNYGGTLTMTSSFVMSNSAISGGGIDNNAGGTLTVTNSSVYGNSARGGDEGSNRSRGGGIFNFQGRVTVTGSSVNSNSANNSGYGVGIYTDGGTLTLTDSTVAGNFVGGLGYGSGIYNNGGTLTVTGSTVAGNSGGGGGGGIENSGTLTLTASTVSGNRATVGGGIENFGTLTVTGSTVAGNSAGAFSGIRNPGTLTVTGSTVAGNSASVGGTIDNGGSARLTSTIVAGNIYFTGGPAADITGGNLDASSSYNLIGTGGSGGLVNGVNHNRVGVANPGLGTLGFYGGPTQTIPLLAGSPAVGTGDPALAYTDDQRGFRRGPTPSVGAAEYVPGNAAYLFVTAPASVTAGVPFAVTVRAVDAYGDPAPGYTGPLVLSSTDPQAPATLGSYELTAADAGTHTFTVTLYSAPAQQLLARTHPFVGVAQVTVRPAAPAFLYLVPSSYSVSAGTPFQVTAVLYDAYSNRVTNFTGQLHFASTDPAAGLPADYAFTAADAGSHAFTLTLNAPGPVRVTASVVGSPGVAFDLALFVA